MENSVRWDYKLSVFGWNCEDEERHYSVNRHEHTTGGRWCTGSSAGEWCGQDNTVALYDKLSHANGGCESECYAYAERKIRLCSGLFWPYERNWSTHCGCGAWGWSYREALYPWLPYGRPGSQSESGAGWTGSNDQGHTQYWKGTGGWD